MDFNQVYDYLSNRLPIQLIPVTWDAGAYTSAAFNRWAGSPAFPGWAGDKETDEQVRVIKKVLHARRGGSCLDVCCGYGRHSLLLAAKHGLKMTGVDISSGLISAANRLAKEKELDITYEVRQAADLPWSREFDYVMIADNSFSLFSPQDAPLVLQGINRALKPGGRLYLDLDNKPYNCRYGIYVPHWDIWPGGLTLQEIFFHQDISVEVCRDMAFKKDAEKAEDFIIFKRIYALKEIKILLADNGFQVTEVYGDWDLTPLKTKSPKMILTGVKYLE